MTAQARNAYEAHARTLGLPYDWDAEDAIHQEAWRNAVVGAIDTPETPGEGLTELQLRLLHEKGIVEVARRLKAMLPPDRGFILFTVDAASIAYISTISRPDAIRAIREWLKKERAL